MPQLPYESSPARYLRLKDVSTRDSGQLNVAFDARELVLRFNDYSGDERRFTFRDVIAFRWQDGLPVPAGVDDDYGSAYEVTSSPWLAELARTETLMPAGSCKHWLFCFHGIDSALEVVAAEMTAA
jgi:hypothetical protein